MKEKLLAGFFAIIMLSTSVHSSLQANNRLKEEKDIYKIKETLDRLIDEKFSELLEDIFSILNNTDNLDESMLILDRLIDKKFSELLENISSILNSTDDLDEDTLKKLLRDASSFHPGGSKDNTKALESSGHDLSNSLRGRRSGGYTSSQGGGGRPSRDNDIDDEWIEDIYEYCYMYLERKYGSEGVIDDLNEDFIDELVDKYIMDRLGWIAELAEKADTLYDDLTSLEDQLKAVLGDGSELIQDIKNLREDLKEWRDLKEKWKVPKWFKWSPRWLRWLLMWIILLINIKPLIEGLELLKDTAIDVYNSLMDLIELVQDITDLITIIWETILDLIDLIRCIDEEPWKDDIVVYGKVVSVPTLEGIPNVTIMCRGVSVKTDENGEFSFNVSSEPMDCDVPPISKWPSDLWLKDYRWLHNCSIVAIYNNSTKSTPPILSQVFSGGKMYWVFCFGSDKGKNDTPPPDQEEETVMPVEGYIRVTPRNEGPGEPVTITVGASGGSGSYYYVIDFGDGSTETVGPMSGEYTVKHSYNEGVYFPSVTVIDANDPGSEDVKYAYAVHISELKIWKFTVSSTDVEPGETVWFTVTVKGDNRVAIISIDFDGDGVFDDTVGPTSGYTWAHVYENQGTYHPAVKIVDKNQASDVKTGSLKIVNGNYTPSVVTCYAEEGSQSEGESASNYS